MANLVSPGVSVTVTDESFFIPASASTVPLIFVATADEKLQPDGVTPAAGTYEYDTVRTVTSLTQSLQLYGIPRFVADGSGNQYHGDARNEYGLLALNQYLGVGNLAYVVRANVNLDDDITDIRALWDDKVSDAETYLESYINSQIAAYNTTNGYVASTPGVAGYEDVSFTPVLDGTVSAGLTAAATYNFTVTVDGGTAQPITYIGTGSETVNDVMTAISTSMTGASAAVTTSSTTPTTTVGWVRFVSDNVPALTPTTSTISLAAGGTAGSQEVSYGGTLTSTTAAGLTASTTYDFNITIDGTGPTNITYTATGTDTIADVISGINADATMSAATGAILTLVSGNLVFTSKSSGTSSTILVAAGGTDLLAALPGFVSISAAVAGTGLLDLFWALAVAGGVTAAYTLETAVAGTLSPYKQTITGADLITYANLAMTNYVFDLYSFQNLSTDFFTDVTTSPLPVYASGYDQTSTGDYLGFDGAVAAWETAGSGSTAGYTDQFTALEGANLLVTEADDFKYTIPFNTLTSLGTNDAARRVSIVTALQATINSNTEVRSENYEYNLILCPGFPELADEMLTLSTDILGEAFVIADTPMDNDATNTVSWAGTVDRQHSSNIAYYYPHCLVSNIDGVNVLAAASGTALRTFTYSDNVSELWFAPGGTTRGLVTGVSDVGYASGTLGSATTFVPVHLNQGQRDDLYKYYTNINPIVFFPGRGIIIWGAKTSDSVAQSLDRINVARLMAYIKRQIRKNTMPFVFEPNDTLTRKNAKGLVDGFLGDLVVRRALYDFASVCDTTNNTPDRIDANELWIDIALKPVKDIEFIYVPIRLVATSAQIG